MLAQLYFIYKSYFGHFKYTPKDKEIFNIIRKKFNQVFPNYSLVPVYRYNVYHHPKIF